MAYGLHESFSGVDLGTTLRKGLRGAGCPDDVCFGTIEAGGAAGMLNFCC